MALAALLAVAWWAYSPGLSGGFLFDDFNNLNQLGAYGRVDNLRSLTLYVTSGSADPIGRPLSLLSFLIDARDWPADPGLFKRTNILLHLLNGTLLAWTLLRLGRRFRVQESQARQAATLGAALWMLHPLLVSTTLYVVQREAMLPASFTLLGILFWVEGCDRLELGRRYALVCLTFGAWGCTALAMLCKANGVLLPLLLLSLEWAAPTPSPGTATDPARSASFRRIRAILLGGPSVILIGCLLAKIPAIWSGETYSRPWTVGQRLLSEPRVICDYLHSVWIPRASGTSVFNDSFRASSDWLHPWTTLPSLAAILALLGLGIKLRRRHPTVSFAIMFYFAGQLLESTVIPLELYFEHRNYLPAMPMFWPLALWLTGNGPLRSVRLVLAAALPAILAVLCHSRAEAWRDPYAQALLLAQVDPDSPRAQANAAAYELAHGRADRAASRLEMATGKMPDEVQLALNWVAADCERGSVTAAAREAAHYALAHNRGDTMMTENWLIKAIETASQNRCNGLDLREVEFMLQMVRDNPTYSASRRNLAAVRQLEGRLALAHGDSAGALHAFNSSLMAFNTPDNALLQAALLGSAGFPGLGLEHLHYFKTLEPAERGGRVDMPSLHLLLLDRDGYWTSEFDHLEKQLTEDAKASGLEPSATNP